MEKQEILPLTIGELAAKVGVTVRTLQYYDKTGLLKASISEGGRRRYNRDDVLKLQQILFLKSFGFSLEEIRDRLLKEESPRRLEQLFTQQEEILLSQISNLQEIAGMLDKVIAEIKAGGEIGLDKLIIMMELMKEHNPYTFVLRYFNDKQLKGISKRFENPEQTETYRLKSEHVFARMYSLYQSGADPAGKEGQELAASWWGMVNEFTAGDPSLLVPLIAAGRDIDNWPADTGDMQQPIKHFLEQALNVYFKNNGIVLPGTEADKND